MKKLLTFLFILTTFTAGAQVYQRDPSYGRSIDRYQVLKALHIPTVSGVPDLSDDVITNTSAIAYDTTGHKFYVYDPSNETWGQVTGGGVVIDPGVDSITYHNNQLCQWVDGVSTCYFLNKFYDSTALNHDSTKIIHFNTGHAVDSVSTPFLKSSYHQSITAIKPLHWNAINADSATLNLYVDTTSDLSDGSDTTVPTTKAVKNLISTVTAEGITRTELIDTADNKVNKTDVSGGTINQVLKKNSSTNYDWSWQDESGGGVKVVIQTYTGSSSVTIADSTTWLIINPTSIASAMTVTLPASPTNGQKIEISFGGMITSGNGVVSAFTLSPNTGQSIVQSSTPSYMQAGDAISYKYNLTTWYRIN